MISLIFRVLLLILSILLLCEHTITIASVLVILGIITVCSISYIRPQSKLSLTTILFYCMACFFVPEGVCFLPLIVFEIAGYFPYKKGMKQTSKIIKILYLAVLFLNCLAPFLLLSLYLHEQFRQYTLLQLSIIAILSVLAGFVRQVWERNVQLAKSIHDVEDIWKEKETSLKVQNHDLMEKQDYEIYLATLTERNRIAREIHDNVGHLLTRSILQTGALSATAKDPLEKEGLESIRSTLDTAMTCIRQSVHDLHDDSIDLHAALLDMIATFSTLQIKLNYDSGGQLPRDVKYCVLSIVREALSNTVKHSDATDVSVIFREHPAFYQLLIEDNGHPKEDTLVNATGIGLITMRERIEKLHGTIMFSTEHGFRIFITFPVDSSK